VLSCSEKLPRANVPRPLPLRGGDGRGLRSLSILPALTTLDISYCRNVTAAGVQALRSTTVAPNLHIVWAQMEEEDYSLRRSHTI
jgi:hypothetical protein